MATSEAARLAPGSAARKRAPAAGRSGGRIQAPLAAFVLHGWDWSESSLILDVFTRSQGRQVVVAKGAKKPTSNFRPVLLPFHALNLWLSKAPADSADSADSADGAGSAGSADSDNELRTLRAAEWAGSQALPAAVLMSGFYLNELLMKGLARNDAHPLLYDAYADTLGALAAPQAGAADEGSTLRAFELVFLRELGVLPQLELVTLTAEPVRAGARYTLRPEVGLVPDADGPSGAAWVALQAALLHGSLAALRQASRPVAAALRAPLRTLVHYHLGTPTLRTREVWLELQRLAEPAPR